MKIDKGWFVFFLLLPVLIIPAISTAAEKETNKYFEVDISTQANMGFKDETAGDKRGGWSDQGDNDLRSFPTGERKFCDIPFKVINPNENKGKSLIILKGKYRDYFPEYVKGIEVGRKTAKIFFLTASAFNSEVGALVAKYIVHYENGFDLEIPVRFGVNIANDFLSLNPPDMPNAKLAWQGENAQCSTIGVFVSTWENPYPGTAINSLDFISTAAESNPALIALTVELSSSGGKEAPGAIVSSPEIKEKMKGLSKRVKVLETKVENLELILRQVNQDITKLWNREEPK